MRWIVDVGQLSWLRSLETAFNEAVLLLAVFPDLGIEVASDDEISIRLLTWSKAPYVSWHAHRTRRTRDVWMLRLFHSRQIRPAPDPVFWSERLRTLGE